MVSLSAPWLRKAGALVLDILRESSDSVLKAAEVQDRLQQILADTTLDDLTTECKWVGGGGVQRTYAPSMISFTSDLTMEVD